MQPLRPCARCEQELPEAFFENADAMFCKRCNHEVQEILRRKYSVIEAAHFRATLRHSTRKLKQRITTSAATAAAGD